VRRKFEKLAKLLAATFRIYKKKLPSQLCWLVNHFYKGKLEN